MYSDSLKICILLIMFTYSSVQEMDLFVPCQPVLLEDCVADRQCREWKKHFDFCYESDPVLPVMYSLRLMQVEMLWYRRTIHEALFLILFVNFPKQHCLYIWGKNRCFYEQILIMYWKPHENRKSNLKVVSLINKLHQFGLHWNKVSCHK